jgi:4-amino-4-deoxy-L-arabinose transferase-like glycosyltransferase
MSALDQQTLSIPSAHSVPPRSGVRARLFVHTILLLAFWLAIYGASLFTPPLLDDADATHAQAAQTMAQTGDWVTLHVNGVRYLEKPPLPYWIAAASLHLFGAGAFAMHLPLALAVLALALLGYLWSRRAFDERTALYTALFTLTAAGVFLFTRIFIPEVLLALFLGSALYAMLRALEDDEPRPARYAYAFWAFMALAVLTKGLVAIVFLLATASVYLILSKQTHKVGQLRIFSGLLLFLVIAAPWHILAGLRNTGGANGHGFFWFYFVNEHYLRFLGRRIPRDYNKLPAALYWTQHLIWLFPWSLFTPAALWVGYRKYRALQSSRDLDASGERLSRLDLLTRNNATRKPPLIASFTSRTVLLLGIFSGFVLVFFSFSTNQEYYTFPIYLPLLMLVAAALAIAEQAPNTTLTLRRTIAFAHAAFTLLGLAIAAALAYGLWTSRHLPFAPDIGALLAHRNVGDYTLSTSHFFDLTGPSFAALRLPAAIAAAAFAIGPIAAWMLRTRRKPLASTLTIALTAATFLIAAHIALGRFAPMLSSQDFAARIRQIERNHPGPDEILIYGDQAFGSSIPFYLDRQVLLVDGRSTSMLFGSTFPDAPSIFLTHDQLLAQWGKGPRKILFVPLDQREAVNRLLGSRQILLAETSGKALITDRPLSLGASAQ